MKTFYHLPDLPYPYDALEPHIDLATMRLHHDKHHATYIEKLNAALEKDEGFVEKPIEELLAKVDHLPQEIRQVVINNGGGHANHSFFWQIMAPNSGGEAKGELAAGIDKTFGSFADFKTKFSQVALNHFGSGWAWLNINHHNELEIQSTPNQNSPYLKRQQPILALDVWEHAYYLKYQNRRVDYIENWWNVVSWNKANQLFLQAKTG